MIFAHLKIVELQYIYFFLIFVRWMINLAQNLFQLIGPLPTSKQKK